MAYTTLEAFKSFAGFEADTEDELLAGLIDAATAIIEDRTNRVFEADSETDRSFSKLNLPGESRFAGNTLYFYDELADEASAITDSPTVTYLPVNGPPYWGMYLTDGAWAYPTVTVTGYWAYSKEPPPQVEMACLRLAKWLYDLRDTTAGSAAVITPEGRVLLPQGLPTDIEAMLEALKKVVVA